MKDISIWKENKSEINSRIKRYLKSNDSKFTDKETEIKKYLLSLINGGVTLINVEGGYSNDKKTLILCVIPTRSYYLVKEGLKAIDKNIFFLATDAYEVGRRIQNETI